MVPYRSEEAVIKYNEGMMATKRTGKGRLQKMSYTRDRSTVVVGAW